MEKNRNQQTPHQNRSKPPKTIVFEPFQATKIAFFRSQLAPLKKMPTT